MIINAGASRVTVNTPAYTELVSNERANLTNSTITYGGLEDVGSI